MKKIVVVVLFALLYLQIGEGRWAPFTPGSPETPLDFKVLSSNSQRTVVELNLFGLYVEDIAVQEKVFQTLQLGISGGGVLTEVGSPQLPVLARLIAIPDDKDVQIKVLEEDVITLKGYNVYPAQPPLPEEQRFQEFVIDEKRYSTNEFYPELSVRMSAPMIMRDFRLVQLVLQPVRFNPVSGELRVAKKLKVELRYEGYSTLNVKTRRRHRISPAFEPLYKSFIANYRFLSPPKAENGCYLIIVNDNFYSAVEPFARWKRRKGWHTEVVTLSEIGGNDTALIYNYIHNAYNNWTYPPDYVLLIGDAPEYLRCNRWPGNTDASDLYYSLQEGNDILADLMIARVCARSLTEAQVMLNKLYKYEKEPYLDNTEWFKKVCALAGYEGSGRFWTVVIRIRNYVMNNPFTQFDTLFERWGLNTAQALTDSLNLGRAWMLYRGHGDVAAWANVDPSWTNSNVSALNNGRMLPMVIAPTCLSGNFDETEDCHAEAWLKAGEEKGGCGYFGASEVSYSGYNDSLAAGTFISYVDSLFYTFAQCTQAGKLFMLQAYPLPDDISEEEIYMFNNFGEPELNIWSQTPKELTVEHPAVVPIGSFQFPVTVTANNTPVENAQVCVMSEQDTTVFYVAHTNPSGEVTFNLETTQPGDSLYVTVTGRNLRPYLGSAITIAPNSGYVLYRRSLINDSLGNSDGIINPGETIELPVWVKNWGMMVANSVTGKLRTSDPKITITDSAKAFGDIPAGDSAFTGPDGFGFYVAPSCTNGYQLKFSLECRDELDSVWNSNITLYVGTPVMVYVTNTINDPPPGGNGDGKLDPGESAQLFVTLKNIGLGNGYSVSGKLRSGDNRLQVTDSLAQFGFIPKDSIKKNSSDPFTLHTQSTIPPETPIPCTLKISALDGYSKTLVFNIVVGEIRTIDPIPDNAQPPVYWAYDDVDTLYNQHPEFSWVEIRNLGTRLTLSDDQTKQVNLPLSFGPFIFYGEIYNQISVCSNGWLAPGYTTNTTYNNTTLPNSDMPPLLAANWDDLYPYYGGGVWYYYDSLNHRFIVEWDSVYYTGAGDWDKFEIIIYDTTVNTPTGDNQIIFQYLSANYYVSSTVGTQDPTKTIAIQYLYNTNYHRGAAGIVPNRAIKFISGEPYTGYEEIMDARIKKLTLHLNQNPLRDRGVVHFSLPIKTEVKLTVFDITGREVRTLAKGKFPPGTHSAIWDGKDNHGKTLAPGVYFIRLHSLPEGAQSAVLITKAVLIK
ncbi:MAG: C25 family cysteine peptidase [candidate division WOR-3 bacterium]